MKNKSYTGALKHVGMFSKDLPNAMKLLSMLVVLGIGTGIADVYILHNADVFYTWPYVLINGTVVGLLAIIIPTSITIILYKALRIYIRSKYIIFVALLAELTYAVFLVLAGAIYFISHSYAPSIVAVLVGDASIFGWWIFVNKLMMNRSKNASLFSLIQPTLNIIFFLPASEMLFRVATPLGPLLIKLYAAIFVFLLISYTIIYFIDSPIKRSLGFSGIDTFSQMLQNWLFSINTIMPSRKSSGKFGMQIDVDANTIIAFGKGGKAKAVLFIPNIHFGPVGTLGSSNFPYLIERYGNSRYKFNTVVLHSTVNEDYNAISSDQFVQLKRAFDSVVQHIKDSGIKGSLCAYYYGESNGCMVKAISLGKFALVTFTRAPRVTEDITPEAGAVLKKALEEVIGIPVLVDAHNSRYESAPKEELDAVRFNSAVMHDYLNAIKSINGPVYKSESLLLGISSINAYAALGEPSDMGPGNMNVVIFGIGDKKFGIIEFNANNIKPQFRQQVLGHIKSAYGIDAELYTTDTHYINSLQNTASNVLGRTTSYRHINKLLDKAIPEALSNMEKVEVFYKDEVIKNFNVWGVNQREKMVAALDSMISLAKVLVPAIIAAGFFAAAWIITLI